ncbi:IclR family transcriptional regulator [Paramicrobacterium fandaimingii]|uniref:IclR family transcriptional regulator n=1 Tax=Paramicrobacterium fandaimingii TaxID=2708079 RepID=UPI00141FA47B|nr:IclR family transcriptional regulator [Microbacterium fandaimingii]
MVVDSLGVETSDDYTIASLDVGLRALDFVLIRDRTTVGELAAHMGIGRSRAHRILRTLELRGYVSPSSSGRGFVAGPAIMRMGMPGATSPSERYAHRPVLECVREKTGEDVHAAVLTGDRVMVTEGRRSPRTPSIGLRIGMVAPAHAMAGGKLLLSLLDDGQVLSLLPMRLARLGPRTIVDRTVLLDELSVTRERGWAMALQESERDVDSIAVLLGGRTWRDRVALVVSCPTHRGGEKRLRELAAIALQAAGGPCEVPITQTSEGEDGCL